MRILIIEDELEITRFLTLELQHEGYAVSSCADGRAGLEQALSERAGLRVRPLPHWYPWR